MHTVVCVICKQCPQYTQYMQYNVRLTHKRQFGILRGRKSKFLTKPERAYVEVIRVTSLWHDDGKIGIPDAKSFIFLM
jgi:hypothetical protein